MARVALLAILCAGWAVPGFSETKTPHAVYLTWQGDTGSTITVNFLTSFLTTESEVRYDTEPRGNNPTSYAWRANGSSHRIPGYPEGPVVHWVELTGLEAGQTYFFIAGDPYAGFAEERKFRTIPNDGSPVRFVAGGNMGGGEAMRRLSRIASLLEPRFAVIGGDIAGSAGAPDSLDRWNRWIAAWCEDMVTPAGYTVPIVLAIGSHEARDRYRENSKGAPFTFGLFAQDRLKRSYFRRRFGPNLELFVLDSGQVANYRGQARWLEEVLEDEDRIDTRFRGAVYDVPLYPGRGDYADDESETAREYLAPVFDRFKFSFAFENRDRTFKRSREIRRDVIADDGDGTLYLGDGAWGLEPRAIDFAPRWYLAKAGSLRHFWQVDIFEHGLEYRAIDLEGRVFDAYPTEVPDAAAAQNYFESLNQNYKYNGDAVVPSPIFADGSRFRKGDFDVTIRNREPYPAVAEVGINGIRGMEIDPPIMRMVLQPGEERVQRVSIKLDQPLPPDAIDLFKLWYIADYDRDGKIVRRAAQKMIGIEAERAVKAAKKAPTIDGDLSEWDELRFESAAHGVSSIPARNFAFDVSYDPRFLYLGVRVRPSGDSSGARLRVWLSTYPEHPRVVGSIFTVPLSEMAAGELIEPKTPSAGKTVSALQNSDGEYRVEAAVPISRLIPMNEDSNGETVARIRVNLAVYRGSASAFWRPEWKGEDDYPWSGVFSFGKPPKSFTREQAQPDAEIE